VQAIITEDDEPVDNLPSEKQQRLLTETLYNAWSGPGEGRSFLAAANVGVFYLARRPAIVPDMFLSLDVEVPENWWEKEHRSYFLWEFGKPPDLAIEIVSNKEGDEDGEKRKKYARIGVRYYVIYDPRCQIMPEVLTVYRLQDWDYVKQEGARFPSLRLGLTLWDGEYEGKKDTWLRWVDESGVLLPAGKEGRLEEQALKEQERQCAEQERRRAEQAEALLEQERQRAERLAERLRQLGQSPD
jgi:Uma2 family endonuclease